jgi:pyruvate carboxylase
VTSPPKAGFGEASLSAVVTRAVDSSTHISVQVAIYSAADRLFPHRFSADVSYQIGDKDTSPVGCYLDIEYLIKIAKEHNVDAIHPGYGFLSENAQLSRRCREEGIKFVGPPPEVIDVRSSRTSPTLHVDPTGTHSFVQSPDQFTTAFQNMCLHSSQSAVIPYPGSLCFWE